MTIEEKVKEWLVGQGMFENQAAVVLEMMKADEANEAMAGRWADRIEGYHSGFFAIIAVSARDAALRYIDANCPHAWFRPMFV